jgi:hypothetical protein
MSSAIVPFLPSGALRKVFTYQHCTALAKHEGLQKEFPNFNVEEYLEQLALQVDWAEHGVLNMTDFPDGAEGTARFTEALREAAQLYDHVDIYGALTRTDNGENVIETAGCGSRCRARRVRAVRPGRVREEEWQPSNPPAAPPARASTAAFAADGSRSPPPAEMTGRRCIDSALDWGRVARRV